MQLQNKLRFLSLDLLYAHHPDGEVCNYLLRQRHDPRSEYDWFMAGEPPGYQIMGNDYYGRNEQIMLPDGEIQTSMDVLGWYNITHEYYQRYKKPVMHTETNVLDAKDGAHLALEAVGQHSADAQGRRARAGLHLVFAHRPDRLEHRPGAQGRHRERLRPLRPGPQAPARGRGLPQLLQEYGQITIVPHGELFEQTSRPATLKTEI